MKAIYGGETIADTFQNVTAYGTDVTPAANFSYSLTSGNTYSFISSTLLNHGSINKYVWNFDDGNILTGNASILHTYDKFTTDKTYNVKLTVTSNAGCTSFITNKVIVPAVYSVSGSFNYFSTSPCAPSTEIFTFSQNISGAPTTAAYRWDFGDGTSDVGKTVTKQYNDAGSRKVVLSVYNNAILLYAYSNPANIKSYGPDVTPTPSFDIQQDNNTPNVVSFNSTSSIPHGSIQSLSWTFGDGSTATGYNVKHIYAAPGNTDVSYSIKLTVTGDSNCSSDATKIVIVPHK
jgi:PKD repeat protein